MNKKIETIGIIGEGKMGTGLFYYLLDFGFRLVWIGSETADIEKTQKGFQKKIKRGFENGLLSESRLLFLRENVIISDDLTSIVKCDLVIEAIPENMEMKRALFIKIDTIVRPDAILASNSSSINPSLLVPSGQRKGNFTGLHFFYPIPLKNIVEFVITQDTSKETTRIVKDFLNSINRKFLLLKEKDSFILNRIFLDFQNEAFLIVREEKLSISLMDAIVKENFFPSGVFEFIDSVGTDIMAVSVRNYIRDYPHKDYYEPLLNELDKMVAENRLGQKSLNGFYQYPKEPSETILPFRDNLSNKAIFEKVVKRLKFSYISSVKRFAIQSKLNLYDLNESIREYFGTDKGPLTI
ncbi:MAG: 3-hydroxyacyl-CoA dehydrogenase family protein [Bacteroidetes bacterium]|nr:3-hydroxyacyl-CoA dehydrogenase family protein [Bacteroidota bacterium]